MPVRNSMFFERVTSVVLAAALLFFYYHQVILHPNDFISSDTGDGIMNHTSLAGHVKNDLTYSHFSNMNYPYGQLHIYTAAQTLFAQLLKFLAGFHPWFVTYSMGIINMIMLFSYVACAFVICLILQRLHLSSGFIILGSVGITFLSPQIFRITGHPELCYAVCFPLSWWLLIKYFESSRKTFFTSLIILNSLFWFFVYPYYVIFIAVFYTAYYGILLIQREKYFKNNGSGIIAALVQIGLPLILSRLYLAVTDTHEFRPQHPYGFNIYYATLSSVFAPVGPPLDKFYQLFFSLNDRNWEGWSYIGFSSVLLAIYSAFRIIRYLFKKNFGRVINPVLPPVLKTAVIAVIPILIYSMCMPFRLAPEFFFGHLGFLEQFRALGRFAWMFYYVFTVYSVYVCFLIYRRWNMKSKYLFAKAWCIFFFSFFFIESISYHKSTAASFSSTKNVFNWNLLDPDYRQVIIEINNIKNRFQCIIPLPFYHVGTDNFDKEFTDKAIKSSMVVSYWTNVPLLASSTARTPLFEAKNKMQFFSPPFLKKNLEKDLPDKRSFLVLYTNEQLNEQEKYYMDRSTILFKNDQFVLAELQFDTVFKSTAAFEIEHFKQLQNSLVEKNGFYMSDTSKFFFYKSFDELESEIKYNGTGAISGLKRDYTFLVKDLPCSLDTGREYVISYWLNNKIETSTQTDGIVEEKGPDGNSEWNVFIRPIESLVIDGDWSLAEKEFKPKYRNESISILFAGNGYSNLKLYADELMIREKGLDVYKILSVDSTGGIIILLKNNLIIKS